MASIERVTSPMGLQYLFEDPYVNAIRDCLKNLEECVKELESPKSHIDVLSQKPTQPKDPAYIRIIELRDQLKQEITPAKTRELYERAKQELNSLREDYPRLGLEPMQQIQRGSI